MYVCMYVCMYSDRRVSYGFLMRLTVGLILTCA